MSPKMLFGLVFLVLGLTTSNAQSPFLTIVAEILKHVGFLGLDYILDEFVKGTDNEEILKKIDQRFVQLDARLRRIEALLQDMTDLQNVLRAQEVENDLNDFLNRYKDIAQMIEANLTGNSTTVFNRREAEMIMRDEIKRFHETVKITIPRLLERLHVFIAGDSKVAAGRGQSLIRGYIVRVLQTLESVNTYNVTLAVHAIDDYMKSLTEFQFDCFSLYNSTCFTGSPVCERHFAELQERLIRQANVFEAHTPSVLRHLSSNSTLENIGITNPINHKVLYNEQTVSIVQDGGVADISSPAKAGLRCYNDGDQWNLVQHQTKPGYLLQSHKGCYLAFDKAFLKYKIDLSLLERKEVKFDKKDFLLCQNDSDKDVAIFLVTADSVSRETFYTFNESSTGKYLNVKVQGIGRRLTLVTFLNKEKANSWMIDTKPSLKSSCDSRHQTSLHTEVKPTRDQNPPVSNTVGYTDVNEDECTMAIIPVKVKLKNGIKVIDTYVFLDPVSSATFCTEDIMDELGATGKKISMTLDTMAEPDTISTYSLQGLQICSLDHNHIIDLPRVYTKDKIPVTPEHIPTEDNVSQWPHLKDIHVSLPQIKSNIGLLIGNNIPDAYTPLEIRSGTANSPHASRTRLGWVVWNVLRTKYSSFVSAVGVVKALCNSIQVVEDEDSLKRLDQIVRQSFNMDFPEKVADSRREHSQEDKQFLQRMKDNIKLVNGHYQIPLPFRDENIRLPTNHLQAQRRLNSLKKKLLNNTNFFEEYKKFMDNILMKGYAEQVPNEDLSRDDGHVWYIPHHGVYHPKKNKLKVVFDCTATYEGISLNQLLSQGPDLTNTLLGVLLRFRQEHIAITGDIESMFYQVRVPPQDCDCLRFYWWKDGDLLQEPVPYRMLVHLFGAVSSPSCSNAALRQTAEDNQRQFEPSVVETVNSNFYVDDCLASVPDEEKAAKRIQNVSALCQKGGFRVTKWLSNSKDVIETISKKERASDVKDINLELETLPNDRALGVVWIVESDQFGFKVQKRDDKCTRRTLLSIVNSLYDPLGFVSPFVLPVKLILQELCRLRLDWDDGIPDKHLKVWNQWLNELPQLERLRLLRCYKPKDFGVVTSCQLHLFSDASNQGYGVVSCLRLKNSNREVHISQIMSKARVAPLKKMTVPKMELTAACVAARLIN